MKSTKLVSVAEVAEIIGVSKITVRRWVKAGSFPPGIRCGRRLIRWNLDTVQAWLNTQEQLSQGTSND
jgi:excisionase family DNA binding protein